MALDDGAGQGVSTEELPPAAAPADAPSSPPIPARPATDWERYGRRPTGATPPPAASGIQRDVSVSRRRPEPREDLYADYRRESKSSGLWRERKPSRARANLAGVGLVFGVAVMFVVAGIVATENAKPKPTPTSTATPTATVTASPTPLVDGPTTIPAIVGPLAMVADLPSSVDVPDRSMPQEDGGMIYLGGDGGGLQFNAQTAEVKVRSAGYGKGIGRQVVAGGSIWRSTSPADPSAICGPGCWAKATTYQLDAGTGKLQKTFQATYLVGYDANAVWVAGSKGVQKLDPGSAAVLVTVPWKANTEPRVGCGGLWSVSGGAGDYILRKANSTTGALVGQDNHSQTFFYGPVQVHGHCWTIGAGVAGAVLPPSNFGIVTTSEGIVSSLFRPDMPVVILDGEFWAYESGGVMQRYDPLIGRYGQQIQLAVLPVVDSPYALFASMHKLWAIDGQRLIGYDVTTGATGTGS